MKTPKHFEQAQFTDYIYECAIRDRMTYLDSIIHCYGPEDSKWIEQTKEEIKAMKNRRKIAKNNFINRNK